MQLAQLEIDGVEGIGVRRDDHAFVALMADEAGYPGSLQKLVTRGAAALEAAGRVVETNGHLVRAPGFTFLPPITRPGKIVCVGLNYADHASETGFQAASYPSLFCRFASTLVGHGQPLVCPRESEQLDYEGELVAVIGKRGRRIDRRNALDHVVAYSIFNDATLRDYQTRTTQWTPGKNFDATGAFGPVLTLASAVPPGARGLTLETRLNGQLLQSASTDQMIFSVVDLVAIVSEVMTLGPGDLIVTGTPSGVGFARKPPLFMKDGDVCEVSITGLGTLRNAVVAERKREP